MAEKKGNQQPTDPGALEQEAPATAEPTVVMMFEGRPYTGTLMIGIDEIAVIEGVAQVPVRLITGASHAGFRVG
jgi:hypothetical protein